MYMKYFFKKVLCAFVKAQQNEVELAQQNEVEVRMSKIIYYNLIVYCLHILFLQY